MVGTVSLPSAPEDFEGCQRVQRALLLSTIANTVTTLTQTCLEFQENHLKVPLGTSTTTSAIKIGGVTNFFLGFSETPPL